MNIRDKLRVELSADYISLQPNRMMTKHLLWDAGSIVAVVIGWLLFREELGNDGVVFILILIAAIVLHMLRELLFRSYVRYIFDKHNNSVYRENLFLGKRKLMALEDAMVFTNSDMGDWHYRLGIKKKQFLRSYKISPGFGSGRASRERAQEYETEILAPIRELLGQ